MATRDLTDADLLRAMAGRDEGALRELYDRHALWISARLARRCADPTPCRTSSRTPSSRPGTARPASAATARSPAWLWGIAIRRLISRLRKRADFRLGPALVESDIQEISAEERVLLRLENVDVGSAMARISPELRVVLQLTVLDGLSTREAAVLLGIPRGTVKSRLQRARATMREELA